MSHSARLCLSCPSSVVEPTLEPADERMLLAMLQLKLDALWKGYVDADCPGVQCVHLSSTFGKLQVQDCRVVCTLAVYATFKTDYRDNAVWLHNMLAEYAHYSTMDVSLCCGATVTV